MSKVLSHMLGKSEQVVSEAIARLEHLSGLPSEDVRIVSDTNQLIQQKVSEIGLDPQDTTAEELYHSLQVKYASDSQKITQAMNLDDNASLAERMHKAASLVKHALGKQEQWALKSTAAKSLLAEHPPKRLMKQMGYRTVASLLKREAIEGLMLAIVGTESPAWQRNFQRAARKLDSSNYVMRQIRVVYLDPAKFQPINNELEVVASNLTASVALWPTERLAQMDTLALALKLSEGLEQFGMSKQLLSLHPALGWWSDTAHLIYSHDGQAVSMNIGDVALNQDTPFHDRRMEAGRQSLWSELSNRYKQYSEHVSDALPGIEQQIHGHVAMQPALAAETIEVEI